MAAAASGSLREQLCQIEQSLGVCHVAEFQAWPAVSKKQPQPGPSRSLKSSGNGGHRDWRTAPQQSSSNCPGAAAVAAISVTSAAPSDSSSTFSRGPGANPPPGAATIVHQPLQPKKVALPGSTGCGGGTGTSLKPLPSADKMQGIEEDFALDSHFMQQLDLAVSRAVEDGHLRDIAPLPVEDVGLNKVVELGPACPPKDAQATPAPAVPAPPLLGAAPRLPKQLAEIRQQLQMLTANCDKLQALTSKMNGCPTVGVYMPPLEHLEAEHASTMGRASRLLEAPMSFDFSEPTLTPTRPQVPTPPPQLTSVVEQPRQPLLAQLTPRQPAAMQQTACQQHLTPLQPQLQQTPGQLQTQEMPFKQSL
eukprot:TRINITY_DN72100_c0_g1_i1.p1 TRINITY_DN72100_c0_g1~~TRINITY_DN72100_c0_g1_i1.p1  ORF type:complete len:375 (+),score=98.51 TRINITY_DN72100_c0_g1_i1:35-1126(+)